MPGQRAGPLQTGTLMDDSETDPLPGATLLCKPGVLPHGILWPFHNYVFLSSVQEDLKKNPERFIVTGHVLGKGILRGSALAELQNKPQKYVADLIVIACQKKTSKVSKGRQHNPDAQQHRVGALF